MHGTVDANLNLRPRYPARDSLQHFERLSTPIWVFNVTDHRIWWANTAALAFWEADSLEDLLNRDFSSDSEAVRMRLRQMVSYTQTTSRLQDTWTVYPNDQPKTVNLNFQPVLIEHSSDGLLVEINYQIERKADADSMRILEAARISALMVSTFSTDGALLSQNPAALARFGAPLPKTNAQQTDLTDRLSDPAIAHQMQDCVAHNQAFDIETEAKTLEGLRIHRIHARRGRDPVSGAPVMVVSEEDVTEQSGLRAELKSLNERLEGEIAERTQRLRESEERYALATEAAVIWDWDIEGDNLFFSPKIAVILGYPYESMREILDADGLTPLVEPVDQAAFCSAVQKHISDPDDTFSHEFRLKTKDGDTRWFQARGKCQFKDGRGVRSIGLLSDISERKELEMSLLSAQRLEAVGQLTGGIAHDFNNLLTVIQGNAQLLELGDTVDHELTSAISAAVLRGAELTRHLLSFARKQTLRPSPVDLTQLIAGMANTLLRALGEDVVVAPSVPADIWWPLVDSAQLETALLNLAINGRDAMNSQGTLGIQCMNHKITAASRAKRFRDLDLDPGHYVEISVSDTGVGMTADLVAKAVEPFFTTKDVGKGSGLGLSMVYGFARQSGGALRITSTPDKGTNVSVFLPRAEPTEPRVTPNAPGAIEPGQGEHIHVVEDNAEVQSTLSKLLTSMNYTVSQSSDAAQALTTLKSGPAPCLVLVDMILPGGMKAAAFAERLRTISPDLRILFISGYPAQRAWGEDKLPNGLRFLQKPLEKSTLSKAIRAALDE